MSGVSIAPIRLSNVLLPEPEAPVTAIKESESTFMLTEFKTTTSPKRFVTFSTRIAAPLLIAQYLRRADVGHVTRQKPSQESWNQELQQRGRKPVSRCQMKRDERDDHLLFRNADYT